MNFLEGIIFGYVLIIVIILFINFLIILYIIVTDKEIEIMVFFKKEDFWVGFFWKSGVLYSIPFPMFMISYQKRFNYLLKEAMKKNKDILDKMND